jgi:hypothetical protein
MIKKKNLREKLQQRQNQKRDLKDGTAPGKGAPLPVTPVGAPRSSEIQILDERANSASYIQKPGAHPVRGVPVPPQLPSSGVVPPTRSSQRGASIPIQTNLPSAAPPAHTQLLTPRGKGVKPPRPGTNLLKFHLQ